MLAMFLATVAGRNSIRSHWWTYRLSICTDAYQRAVYVRKMGSLGPVVLGASARLAHHGQPRVRLDAVGVWRAVHHPRAVSLLTGLTTDRDAEVRRAAITALGEQGSVAMPSSAPAFDGLRDVIGGNDERDAMIAVAVIARIASDRCDALLAEALRSSRFAGVKVQAIECIREGRRVDWAPALIAALDDTTVFHGLTEGQRLGRRALSAIQSDLDAKRIELRKWKLDVATSHVVGACAADALTTLTGRFFDYDRASPESRLKAIRDWRSCLSTDDQVRDGTGGSGRAVP